MKRYVIVLHTYKYIEWVGGTSEQVFSIDKQCENAWVRVCAGMAEKGEEEEYRRRSRRRKFDYFIFLTNPDTGNDETESTYR